jgi:tRNA(His) guanylyltransferase
LSSQPTKNTKHTQTSMSEEQRDIEHIQPILADDDDKNNNKTNRASPLYVEIAERMKHYESHAQTMECIDTTKPYMIRLDGHTFHTFAAPFNKPFDSGLHEIMVRTTKDLMGYFNSATCGYTQSDEITLIFPPLNPEGTPDDKKRTLDFRGRVIKTATLAAGYCSSRFVYWCNQLANDGVTFTPDKTEKYDRVIRKLLDGFAHFDGRVFNVDNNNELLNNIKWRSNYDCVRNSRMNLARAHFSQKDIMNLTAKQAADKLKEEKGVDWKDTPASFRYGTFVKREKRTVQAVNEKTKQPVDAIRTALTEKSFGLPNDFEEDLVDLLLIRYWNDVPQETLQRMLQ